jgi:hypothetical protein
LFLSITPHRAVSAVVLIRQAFVDWRVWQARHVASQIFYSMQNFIFTHIATIIVDYKSTNMRHSSFLFELSNVVVDFLREFMADANTCVVKEKTVYQGLAPTEKCLVDEGESYEARRIVRREMCCHQLECLCWKSFYRHSDRL